ncbi:MAG TPA: hypothetical protein DIS73_02900, partial [Planctomycetia bacterium]|nr:hypothetical protein [Planctomycetia bacterium]
MRKQTGTLVGFQMPQLLSEKIIFLFPSIVNLKIASFCQREMQIPTPFTGNMPYETSGKVCFTGFKPSFTLPLFPSIE